MAKTILKKITAFNNRLTVRSKLLVLIVSGLALTMGVWGIIQLAALERILVEQQAKRLKDVAETVSTFYQDFPTKKGLKALESALHDHLQADGRLARIDIFDIGQKHFDYVAGASRDPYQWADNSVMSVMKKNKLHYMKIMTENGPALGLLYPVAGNTKSVRIVIGIISFSRANEEIVHRAGRLLIISSAGLLIFILVVLGLSYRWIIGKPLKLIIHAIDEFQEGQYDNRIPIVHRDEWGQISRHFNMMADEIQDVMERNQELTKHLEKRVHEETIKVFQLQKQVTDLKQLTTLGQLTANLAHDLGTPLHSIAGLAKLLLEKGGLPENVEHKLNLIVQQTLRLDAVIQNVRKAIRLPDPSFEALPVEQIFHEMLSLMEPFLQKNNVESVVTITNPVSPLYVDRYRIQTALMNVMQNALEAMPEGGTITMSAHEVPCENFVAITVSDTGYGMTPDVVENVCEPFYSTKTSKGLRGLGMAIVRDVMKIHRGQMEIKSSRGQGTMVILCFPKLKDADHFH